MKRIVIANQKLGIITQQQKGGQLRWSSSILASQQAFCFEPAGAIEFLRTSITEQATPDTFILPIEYEHSHISRDHKLLAPVSHLWLLKIVPALITGTVDNKPVAMHTCWRGNEQAYEQGHHQAAFEATIEKAGIVKPTIYNEQQVQLLQKALARVVFNDATPLKLQEQNQSQKIRDLIQSIKEGDHPVKLALAIKEIQQHLDGGHSIH